MTFLLRFHRPRMRPVLAQAAGLATDRRVVLRAGLSLATAAALLPYGAHARPSQEHVLIIQDHEFEPVSFKPQVGDTLRISNHADITHNLYLTYADGQVVTLDTQPPGTERTTVLNQPGRVFIKCWIHPVICLEFDVAPAGT